MSREPTNLMYRLALGSALSLGSLAALPWCSQIAVGQDVLRVVSPAREIDSDEGGVALAEDGGLFDAAAEASAGSLSAEPPARLIPVPEPRTEVITERHPNRAVRIERHIAQDAEGNYFNHGAWSNWDDQGVLRGTGVFRHGLRHGKWVRWFNAGEGKMFAASPYKMFQPPFVTEANFVDDKLDGTWTILDSRGAKASEFEFSEGQLHGLSVWYFPNGQKQREVPYHHGQIEGELREWTLTSAAPRKGGLPTEPIYGLVSSVVYQNGHRQVPHVEYYAPGQKRVDGYYMTRQEDIKTDFDFWNGSIQTTVLSKDGSKQRCGVWTWYFKDGGKQLQGEFRADNPIGVHTWWYANGQKQTEGQYEEGLETGKWVWWHLNGQKQLQGEFVQGEQTGRWIRWNELGKVVESNDFGAGNEVTLVPEEQPPVTASIETPQPAPQRPTLRRPTRQQSGFAGPSSLLPETAQPSGEPAELQRSLVQEQPAIEEQTPQPQPSVQRPLAQRPGMQPSNSPNLRQPTPSRIEASRRSRSSLRR